jgi:hypothetical protein
MSRGHPKPVDRALREGTAAVISFAAIAAITFLYFDVVDLSNASTVSTTFMLVVLTGWRNRSARLSFG